MLTSRLRTRQPPASAAEIAAEQSALEAAIERVESELSWTEHGAIAPDARTEDRFGDVAGDRWSEPDRGPLKAPPRFGKGVFITLAVITAALAAGGYITWVETKQNAPATMSILLCPSRWDTTRGKIFRSITPWPMPSQCAIRTTAR